MYKFFLSMFFKVKLMIVIYYSENFNKTKLIKSLNVFTEL